MVSTVLLLCALAGPAQPSNDNTVYFDGLKHDGASTVFVPNGPRTALTQDVPVKIRSYRFDLTAVTVEYWTGSVWQTSPMAFDQDLATCGESPELPFACILWQGTIPGAAQAVAYRFIATDGNDTNYVGKAAAGTGHQVFNDGIVPSLAESWTLPVPSGGSSSAAPSSSVVTSSSTAVPSSSSAAPSSSASPSSSAVLSSSTTPPTSNAGSSSVGATSAPPQSSSAAATSAVVSSSAGASSNAGGSSGNGSSGQASSARPSSGGGSSAGGSSANVSSGVSMASSAVSTSSGGTSGGGGGDGGPCTPGCRSTTERVVCTATGAPLVLACTAGTECREGACVTPPSEEPPQQGCSCNGPATSAPLLFWGLGLVLLAARRRRG